jgi:rhodanese-related sulfurtransferase
LKRQGLPFFAFKKTKEHVVTKRSLFNLTTDSPGAIILKRRTAMKKRLFVTVAAFMLWGVLQVGRTALAEKPAVARDLAPIVSTAWLNENLDSENLVILDIRSAAAYDEGHIPGAVNEPFVVPFSAWITVRDDLLLEVPDKEDLFAALGNLGITADSWVVVVTSPNSGEPPHYGLANGTRVASTLIYAGLTNVAVLDGGFPKWVRMGIIRQMKFLMLTLSRTRES